MIKYLLTIVLTGIFSFSNAYASELIHKSTYNVDIDDDGKKEIFIYKLKKAKKNYEGSLVIKTQSNKILWEHDFEMTPNDLEKDLLMNEGNITVEHWVKHYFDGSLVYGAKYEKLKIKPNKIDSEYLDFYSKRDKVPSADLRKQILSQKINSTFYYRASWREELVMLVYLPKLERFIAYSGGEY